MWKYVNTDVVIRIDGCVRIVGDTDILYKRFVDGGYDMCLQLHPHRNTVEYEAFAWEAIKGYPREHNRKVLTFMDGCGYDTKNYKGLYQFNFQIQRRCKMCDDFNRMTYALIKYFSLEGKLVDSNDQLLGAFVIHKMLDEGKIMFVDPTVCDGKFFMWHYHHGGGEMRFGKWNAQNMHLIKKLRLKNFNEKETLFLHMGLSRF